MTYGKGQGNCGMRISKSQHLGYRKEHKIRGKLINVVVRTHFSLFSKLFEKYSQNNASFTHG